MSSTGMPCEKHGWIHVCHPHVRLLKNSAFISCIIFIGFHYPALLFLLRLVAFGKCKLFSFDPKDQYCIPDLRLQWAHDTQCHPQSLTVVQGLKQSCGRENRADTHAAERAVLEQGGQYILSWFKTQCQFKIERGFMGQIAPKYKADSRHKGSEQMGAQVEHFN